MNKSIITEISRINQLMGTSLITEASGGWKTIADEILTFVAKKTGKLPDDVTNLINQLKNASLDDDILNILSDLTKISDEMSQIIIPKVMSTITDLEKTYISDVKNFIEENLKNKTIQIDMAKKMVDNFVEKKVITNFKGVKDIIRKELNDYIDNVVSKINEPNPPKPNIDDLSNQIPDDESIITSSGDKISKIFDTSTWTDESLGVLDDINIENLINQSFWDEIVNKFQNLFKVSDEKLKYIQKLAKSIQTTTNTQLKSQLESKLKKELEWLYKKNTNNFVYMKNYFDEVGKLNKVWGDAWSKIKSTSNGGWDFYTTFGSVAKYVPKFQRIWGGITDNIGVLFEAEKNLGSKIINKIFKKEISKVEMVGDFWTNFKTGSRRGFPTMSNEKYKKVIQKYGPTGAKSAYFRDLVMTTLKWNMYTGFFITLRNFIANSAYEDNIQACVATKNINSKECTDLNKNYFSIKMAEWSLKYRENPQESADFIKNWVSEIFGFESNLPDIVTSDKWYKQLSEISTLDPGLIGESLNMFLSILNLNDNPERKQKLLDSLDEQIKFGKEEFKKAEDTVVDAVEDVEKETEEVVGKIENTPLGFEAFVKSKGLTIKTPYITGGVGQTNEPDPNGAKTNNWWFNVTKNTFESY
jgi:hypothetical protein